MSPDSPDVDALREKLRALGYLDAGVGRFVLAPARADRGVWAIAWRASLRIGLVAAVLLGLSGTAALAARVPGLLTGVRDTLVVALYVGLALGGIVSLTVLGVGLAATWALSLLPGVTRRGPLLSRLAGLLVGAAALVYLTLLWQIIGASAPGRWWVVAALAVTVAVSLLLGHATSVMALGLLARDPSSVAPAGLTHRGLAWWGALAVGAFGGAALLYALAGRPPAPPSAPPLVVVPTGLRLTVVAVDGFDTEFARAIVARDSAPRLAALLGARIADVAATGDADPVRVWTTVATGQPPSRHGVEGLETRRLAGVEGRLRVGRSPLAATLATVTDFVRLTRPAVSSGRDRSEHAFWEVAALAGLRTVTVNWWVTWPAQARDGTVLTDRALLRLQHGGPLDREIAPAAVYDTLRAHWPEVQSRADAALGAAWPEERDPGPIGAPGRLVREALRLDALQVELLRRVAHEDDDLITLHVPALDIAQHALFGEPQTLAPSLIDARRAALERAYVAMADLLGPVVDHPGRTVVVIALPGRLGTRAPGLLAATGPGVARTSQAASLRHEDLAPTLLFALGVPVSREAGGHARLDLFDAEVAARSPLRTVASWGRRTVATDAGTAPVALDEAMRERLRSLGYVQ